MEFSDYLVGRKLLKLDELKQLISVQHRLSVAEQGHENGFQLVPKPNEDEPAWINIRRPPFGDVLLHKDPDHPHKDNSEILRAVLERAKVSTLSDLVDTWHRDLIREMECLGHYSTSVICANNLYVNRREKKIVARYLVAEVPPGENRPLIAAGEKIALMEGSSGLFAGFAAAAHYGPAGTSDHRSKCAMISSNGLLNSEFLHNPWLGKSFSKFFMIGGEADLDSGAHTPVHAGVYGPGAIAQFELDWKEPGATTLVVPCRAMTPEQGPLAGPGDVRDLKHAVINSALDANVHNVIFICDYSKLLQVKGLQVVFTKSEWKKLLADHGEQIKIVTTPPKVLREAMAEHPGSKEHIPTVRDKRLPEVFPGVKFGSADFEYNALAAQFHTMAVTSGAKFYEALFLEPKGFNTPLPAVAPPGNAPATIGK